MSERTRRSPADEEVSSCPCGSAWFTLRGTAPNEGIAVPGVVAVDGRGSVIGYAGQLVCVECARPFTPAADRLRAVE